ncbi:MAG: hypothetical protein IJF34_03525 [Clostridia bacterium]|nr:hypothetical protein [Clostridia bacterium]
MQKETLAFRKSMNREGSNMRKNRLELGQFIHWDWGQNYPFGACMSKLIECLQGDTSLYTYDFFAGLAGDDFVMCYGDNERFNDCVSVCTDHEEFLARVYGMIGLEYQIVSHGKWSGDVESYYEKVKRFIDRGIPVLCAGIGNNSNYDLLISYDDDTKKCHLSCGDDVQYGTELPFRQIEGDLIFIENLPKITNLANVYRKAVMQIPALMTSEPTANRVYFVAEAYRKWAEDIKKGRYERYTAETFEGWQHWGIYVCNLATNGGHGEGFLRRAYELNPDMRMIPDLIALFHENEKVWNELEALGGGFNCSIDILHNKEKAGAIAGKIEMLIEMNEKIIRRIEGS